MPGVLNGSHVDSAFGQPTAVAEIPTDPRDNERSTADTLGLMARQALQSSATPEVQRLAAESQAALVGPRDRHDRAAGVYHAIKSRVRFVPDESVLFRVFGFRGSELDRELLVSPEVVLSMPKPAGDCDCHAMLAAATLLAAGVPPVLTTIAQDPSDPRRWSHVYAQGVLEDGTLYPVDTSHGPYPGWQERRAFRRRNWPVVFPPGALTRAGMGRGLGFELAPSGGGSSWGDILKDLARQGGAAATDILGAKWGSTPYYQYEQTPEGSLRITQRTPQGAPGATYPPPVTATPGGVAFPQMDQSTLMWMALIAVVGVGAVFALSRAGGK